MESNNQTKSCDDKYFLIEGGSEQYQTIYSEQFDLLGSSIKAIQINGILHIDDNHWLVQLVNKHLLNLEKMYFNRCSFKNIDNFLSQHIKITHLTFRGGSCEENYYIELPDYRNLKSMELFEFSRISKSSLEQVLCNNPLMERLILSFCDHYFTLSNIMELVYKHLKHLKELNILDSYDFGMDFPPISLRDQFVSVLSPLDSFGMTIFQEDATDLLKRVSSNCPHIKHLELYNFRGYFSQELIDVVCSFHQIEKLSLVYCPYQEQLESIIENLPNLRCLSLRSIAHRSNAQILTILRKCKQLEKLSIESENSERNVEDESIYKKNVNFHTDFIDVMLTPHIRLEFIENDKVIGIVTKDEIIWRNKLLHWVGYDPSQSRSNVRLLNLTSVSEGKHKQPLNLIFNYLDLNSFYSLGMASKECKQLVHAYIYQRCKQSSKKRPRQRSLDREKFYMTDEFGINYNGLRMFGKNIRYLEINLFDYRAQDLLKQIEKYCKNVTTLCFYTHRKIEPHRLVLPQIRHFIFYGHRFNENCIFSCDLSELSRNCPNLEILEIKTLVKFYTSNRKKTISFQNLQKIKFKPFDDSQVKYVKELFKNSNTNVVIDSKMEYRK